jgi:cytochrome c biogenesis protein CcdA
VATTAVLVVLLFAAALSVAVAQERVAERIQATTPAIKHWGGWILVVVGIWFVMLGAFAATFARLFPV